MKLLPRHRLYLSLAAGLFCMHVGVASFARPSFPLTIFGDGVPCLLLLLALLSARENFRNASCLLPLFWKLYFAGLVSLLVSMLYWLRYDSLRRYSAPSPVFGDSFFLLGPVFFLFALALRAAFCFGGPRSACPPR